MTAIQPIDKKLLEEVTGESVTDFTVGEGCNVGDNVAGSLKKITAKTSTQVHHFVFKMFPERMTQENSFVVFMKAFWREHSVYKTVLPKLEEFAKSKGLEWKAPAPKYYKGHNDDKNDYLLLEDVRPSGYVMPDKTISLTLEETSITLKEFAKLHAISYAFLRHEGHRIFTEEDGFQYLVQDEMTRKMLEETFADMGKMFYETAANCLESRFPEGAAKMRKYAKDAGKLNHTMEHMTDNTFFPVLCHFDLWSNNMLLKHDKDGKPIGVKFIDFQFMQKGNVFSDLLYFLYTSTTPDFRRKHLFTVLNLYYDEFCSTIEKMNVPMPWGFTRGFLFDQFELGIQTALVRMTFAIPLQLGMISQTDKKEGEQQALHTSESVKKMYMDSEKAMERLEDLVREMIERKIIK